MATVKLIPFYTKQAEDAEETFKKSLECINLDKNELVYAFDGSSVQNTANSPRTLYLKGTKNRAPKCPLKFRSNGLGFLGINADSLLVITESSKAHEIAMAQIELKLKNIKIRKLKRLLENALFESKVDDKKIVDSIIQQNINKE